MSVFCLFKYCCLLFTLSFSQYCFAEDSIFWWKGVNFGDELSPVIVERILGRSVGFQSLKTHQKVLLTAGSILHYARDGDIIWGSGFRENPLREKRFSHLDIRAVRGPRTRDFLLKKGITCPEVYGDPAILMGYLFPELKREKPIYEYIIIPNIGEKSCFYPYKNVVMPTRPWKEIVQMMLKAKLVISSSLHGIIVAEAFGVPARFLKMTWTEPLLKYQDYYESTKRDGFQYATCPRGFANGGRGASTDRYRAFIKVFSLGLFYTLEAFLQNLQARSLGS